MTDAFQHRFVETIPRELEHSVLYVSVTHAVAVHMCACGCRSKVVTPLSPIHWMLIFDGRAVSLVPSIGNHAFPCKSHYWIERDKVRWSYAMSPDQVELVRRRDARARDDFYREDRKSLDGTLQGQAAQTESDAATDRGPWWRTLFD